MNSILVIRRDNIGDLVCTTPLLSALRQRYPEAWIGALVNSYNATVLEHNPDVDAVIAYRKLKHLDPGESALGALAERAAQIFGLLRKRVDRAVLATPDFVARTALLARLTGARSVAGFSDGSRAARRLDLSVPLPRVDGLHEVERVFALGALFGIAGPIPPLKVVPDAEMMRKAAAAFEGRRGPRIALQISSRRPAQRWPAERYARLIERLHAERGAACMLLWSPGAADHPRHPGDDAKAQEIGAALLGKVPFVSYRAGPLRELIGALAACDGLVSSDGGAVHLAAGLGKPVVCFFGDVSPERWRPWGVPHRVLRPASRKVAEIEVAEVMRALNELI